MRSTCHRCINVCYLGLPPSHALLGQLARMAGDETTRRALFDARTPVEITEILHHAARRS